MTALNYFLSDDLVVVSSDSLVLTEDKKAHKFASKILVLPHLRAVVCGTGSLDLAIEWYAFIQRDVICNDILYLNQIAPSRINSIASSLSEKWKKPLPRSTIYHFGFADAHNSFVGFAYRSTHEYASEALIPSVGIKPPDGNMLMEYEKLSEKSANVGANLSEIDLRQKATDDAKSPHERVGIGGMIHVLQMTKDRHFLYESHVFPDYQRQFAEMLEELRENPTDPYSGRFP